MKAFLAEARDDRRRTVLAFEYSDRGEASRKAAGLFRTGKFSATLVREPDGRASAAWGESKAALARLND